MPQNFKDKKANKQVLRVGIVFLTVGLSALIVFGELTPLFFLGVVFILSPLLAPPSPSAANIA